MNDNAIKSAIESTHFIILTALVFFLIVISTLYIVFSNGFQIHTLDIRGVKVNELYLKWEKGLCIEAASIRLPETTAPQSGTGLQTLHDTAATVLSHADDSWLRSVHIEKLYAGDTNASFFYAPKLPGYLHLHTPKADVNIDIKPLENGRRLQLLSRVALHDFNATARGEGIVMLSNGSFFHQFDINVSGRITLALLIEAGAHSLKADLASKHPFDSIAPLVTPLHLDPDIEQWIVARATGGPLVLHTLHTTLPYAHPEKALDNLYGHLTFYNARYAFTEHPDDFEPAVADHVAVVFKNKVLNIVPVDATFYGQSGGSTWLDIDFNPPHPVLDLYLDTTAQLTPDLHRLIASYNIDLPFVQTRGVTHANLTLHLDLQTKQIKADGEFGIAAAEMNYSGTPIELNTTRVRLENTKITIDTLSASLFHDAVHTDVEGTFDPTTEHGRLRFRVTKAAFDTNDTVLSLAKESTPLSFDYIIFPRRDRLRFAPSDWIVNDRHIHIGGFEAPFSYARFELTLPPTPISLDPFLQMDLSGRINLPDDEAELHADVTKFRIGNFHKHQPVVGVDLKYDGQLNIMTSKPTQWQSDETNLSIGPVHIVNTPDRLVLQPTWILIKNLMQGKVEGLFDPKTFGTALTLSNISFFNRNFGALFRKKDAFKVYIVPLEDKNQTKNFDIIVPSLNMLFSTLKEGWKLHFFSLDAFVSNSPLLREYNLTEGSLSVWSKNGDYPFAFKGDIDYPYALTVVGNKPVNHYRFEGMLHKGNLANVAVNGETKIDINDSIRITSNHVAFNFPEMVRFYLDHKTSEPAAENEVSKNTKTVYIDANATAIVFNGGREAPADRITVEYRKETLDAQFFKGKGGAILDVRQDRFYLYGKNLDDEFMNRFFRLSRFKGGKLNFYVIGDTHKFDGLVRIDNTTIYDYVLLNNLFALINTIPALVTFSLPSYEQHGIKIKRAYADLHYNEGNLSISGLKVDSRELDFAGQGVIDYNHDTIDLTLNVKTQAGENVRKIPLVGYILVGDDNSVMTSFKVSGNLDNPKLTNTIAKDIVVAPFNILKRTLNFPLHYLEELQKAHPGEPSRKKKKKNPHQITSGIPELH